MIKLRKKKKILYIIDSSETGGAESIFFNLVHNTNREMYDVTIGLLYDGWLKDKFQADGFRPIMFPNKKGGFDYIFFGHLLKFLWREQIDIVCAHLFTASLYASIAGKLMQLPVISVFHGVMDVSDSDKFAFVKFSLLKSCATKIVFVSDFLRDFFQKKYSINCHQALTIYNGVNSCHYVLLEEERQLLRSKLGLSQDEILVLAVGDTHIAKDYPTLIKSIGIALKKNGKLKLVIAGRKTKNFSELTSLTAKLNLSKKVLFLGYYENIRELFAASNLYVSSSTSEGFSLTLVEAMMAGVPVIATKSGGPEEIIKDSKTGMLVPAASPTELADAILKLSDNLSLHNSLAFQGQLHAKTKFAIETMINGYEQVFREIVK